MRHTHIDIQFFNLGIVGFSTNLSRRDAIESTVLIRGDQTAFRVDGHTDPRPFDIGRYRVKQFDFVTLKQLDLIDRGGSRRTRWFRIFQRYRLDFYQTFSAGRIEAKSRQRRVSVKDKSQILPVFVISTGIELLGSFIRIPVFLFCFPVEFSTQSIGSPQTDFDFLPASRGFEFAAKMGIFTSAVYLQQIVFDIQSAVTIGSPPVFFLFEGPDLSRIGCAGIFGREHGLGYQQNTGSNTQCFKCLNHVAAPVMH